LEPITVGQVDGQPLYTLDVPNSEVRESLLEHLLNVYTDYSVVETEMLRKDLRRMLACVPYELHIGKEAYYHSILLIWIKLLGFDIQGEIMTNIGRIDAVWNQPELTVVAELKYHADKPVESLLNEAMKQILDRRYYEKYLDRKVLLMGVAFTGKEVACRMETIKNNQS
jgi:hypothetical protein